MTPDVQPPIIDRYGYSWVQHPDGLYYGPPWPSDDDIFAYLEEEGSLGHSSVQRGEYRYFLRHPEDEEPRSDRFGWDADAIEGMTLTHPDGSVEPLGGAKDDEEDEG